MYTLIATAKLNDVDPQTWLADVLARIADLPRSRVHELLPWNWNAVRDQTLAALAGFHPTFSLPTSRTHGAGPLVPRYSPDGYGAQSESCAVCVAPTPGAHAC